MLDNVFHITEPETEHAVLYCSFKVLPLKKKKDVLMIDGNFQNQQAS